MLQGVLTLSKQSMCFACNHKQYYEPPPHRMTNKQDRQDAPYESLNNGNNKRTVIHWREYQSARRHQWTNIIIIGSKSVYMTQLIKADSNWCKLNNRSKTELSMRREICKSTTASPIRRNGRMTFPPYAIVCRCSYITKWAGAQLKNRLTWNREIVYSRQQTGKEYWL